MKKLRSLLVTSLFAVGLAPVVSADAIEVPRVTPAEVEEVLFLRALPWILVGALAVLTVILILHFKKRK